MNHTTVTPKRSRISGTLHRRGPTETAPREEVDLAQPKAEQSEVTGAHEYRAQKDHEGAR